MLYVKNFYIYYHSDWNKDDYRESAVKEWNEFISYSNYKVVQLLEEWHYRDDRSIYGFCLTIYYTKEY